MIRQIILGIVCGALIAAVFLLVPRAALASADPVRVFGGMSQQALPAKTRIPSGPERAGHRMVSFPKRYEPGSIVVSTSERRLYLVTEFGRARVYDVGVGRKGFQWSGTAPITRKAKWPDWTPPPNMRKREPWLPAHMPGGPDNPLGARALYIGDTLYRIHGTSEIHSIGRAMSSGCIRMLNDDVIDLYERVEVGASVHVYH